MLEGTAIKLTTKDENVETEEVFELKSDQEETDTRVVLYAMYGAKIGYDFVRVRSPDSDIFFILLHHAPNICTQILFDTGTGNKKRLLNVTKKAIELGPVYCTALLALHALTGCDTTSSLKGIGKIKPTKILKKMPKFKEHLSNLGKSWTLSDSVASEIEHFMCCIYGFPRIKKIDMVRLHILRRKCDNKEKLDSSKTIDLASFPPCWSSLQQHLKRVNFQVRIWKLANENFPEIPDPTLHGWTYVGDSLEPTWSSKPILPTELVDLMEEKIDSDSEEEVIYESDVSVDSDLDF